MCFLSCEIVLFCGGIFFLIFFFEFFLLIFFVVFLNFVDKENSIIIRKINGKEQEIKQRNQKRIWKFFHKKIEKIFNFFEIYQKTLILFEYIFFNFSKIKNVLFVELFLVFILFQKKKKIESFCIKGFSTFFKIFFYKNLKKIFLLNFQK